MSLSRRDFLEGVTLSGLAAADQRTGMPAQIPDRTSARHRTVLSEGWFVKRLDAPNPDIDGLTREAASPDKSWLSARMLAQVHDVLLEHSLISDPHLE